MASVSDVRSVYVTNISPSANEKTVSDFFSFCGKISKLYLQKEEGKDTSSAVIQFETESAAKTALLLTNALIVDRPITVTVFSENTSSTESTTTTTTSPIQVGTPVENIQNKDFGGVKDEDRSKTSVVASLLAAGYQLAENALEKAKEVDEKSNFSARAKVVVDQMVVKAHEIDQQYKISEKATSVKNSVTETAKKLDSDYGISDKASTAATVIKTTAYMGVDAAKSGLQKAQENPTIKKGVDSVKSAATSVANTVNDITIQTRQEIDEKHASTENQSNPPTGVTMETNVTQQ